MKLYIIGRVLARDDTVEAFNLYDPEEKKTMLIDRTGILLAMKAGHKIVGVREKEGVKVSAYSSVRWTEVFYKVFKTDVLEVYTDTDGKVKGRLKGEPVSLVLLGMTGFGDETRYRVVDGEGKESIISHAVFKDKVSTHNLVGASHRVGIKYSICQECNNRVY